MQQGLLVLFEAKARYATTEYRAAKVGTDIAVGVELQQLASLNFASNLAFEISNIIERMNAWRFDVVMWLWSYNRPAFLD